MSSTTNIYPMQKRGQGVELVGAIFLIGIILIGSLGSYKVISENRYVGDTTTKIYYDLKTCNVDSLAKENLISFKNLDEAIDDGYQPAPCS